MNRMKGFVVFLSLVGVFTSGFSQEFIEGITLFNRGEYDQVILLAEKVLTQNPDEEGLVRYFLAESYYNKGITEPDISRARQLFQDAWKEFQKAANSTDLKANYRDYSFYAQMKMGWCSYRLAELDVDPKAMLSRAYTEFLQVDPEVSDSIKIQVEFMAGESKIGENLFSMYEMAQTRPASAALNSLLKSYQSLNELYDNIILAEPATPSSEKAKALAAMAKIRKADMTYYSGRLYQILAANDFNDQEDPGQKASAKKKALSYFGNVQYDRLFEAGQTVAGPFASILSYSDVLARLNQYFVSGNPADRRAFVRAVRQIEGAEFGHEKLFRLAQLYHSNPDLNSEEFNDFSMTYYDSARAIDESVYWLACVQMLQNDKEHSRANFQQFIDRTSQREFVSDRRRVLLEDALYRKYLLDFESFYLADRVHDLNRLQGRIAEFAPSVPATEKRKEQLNLLVNCAVARKTSEIWDRVLKGDDYEKLNKAMATIRFILPRAAFNIGEARGKYIALLQRMFELTENGRAEETLFFKGIVKSLEAEIQARPEEKEAQFEQAAHILDQIKTDSEYKNEAEYVRGRSLFFAGDFEGARDIFTKLINDDRNVGALFYLAELCRQDGHGLAARKCFEAIIRKAEMSNEAQSTFWYYNALAGKASADESGDLTVLNGIRIEDVAFQTDENGDRLTYENLADDQFLKRKYVQQSIDWMQKFSLPKREIYPSVHRLEHSLFISENVFTAFPGLIDEVRGAVTSSLTIAVHHPGQAPANVEVWLNDEVLTGENGKYAKDGLALKSRVEVFVKSPDCYPYIKEYEIRKPGDQTLDVLLTRRLSFAHTLVKNKDQYLFPVDSRRDRNHILLAGAPDFQTDSDLVKDWTRLHELRDVAIDRAGNRILVVNAKENSIWTYSNEPQSKRLGVLRTDPNISLDSPEGLAVDAEGNIFVADWGHARIVQLAPDGTWIQSFGDFGTNRPADEGQPIKLVYPTRIEILEDHEGVSINGQSCYREKYLLVADHNGIQLTSLDGKYLSTLISPLEPFPKGTFYGFSTEGYDRTLRLYLVDRSENANLIKFVPN